MPKFFLTNKAVEDLSKIWEHTYDVWSENQADRYYDMLIETCKEISEHPEKGKNYPEIETNILGCKVGKHIIFYQAVKANQIRVLRILHERMDVKNRLDE